MAACQISIICNKVIESHQTIILFGFLLNTFGAVVVLQFIYFDARKIVFASYNNCVWLHSIWTNWKEQENKQMRFGIFKQSFVPQVIENISHWPLFLLS